jgi:predicted esterase
MDGSVPVKVVIPTAPNRELSIFDEWWVPVQERKNKSDSEDASSRSRPRQKVVQFRAWYDYLTDADGKREDHINFQSLLEVQRALHSDISREADELGGRFDRVIVGGKSQGCCTALDATLTFPHRLGGFIGIVGHILGCTPVDPDGPQVKIPMHFFHEPEDHLMRWEWVQKGEQRLKDAGYHVRSRRQPDPEGNGHYVDGVEGAWIRSALRMICKAA